MMGLKDKIATPELVIRNLSRLIGVKTFMNNDCWELAEKTLKLLDIEDISELKDVTLSKFIQQYPNITIQEDFVLEMNKRGYLYPEKNDKFLREIQMSTRLCNILARNGVFIVSQIGNYPKEAYLAMRNMGEETYNELQDISELYQIEISTLDYLKEELLPVHFSARQLLTLYEHGIHSVKDIEDSTIEELRKEYRYDRRLYNSLRKEIEVKGLLVKSHHDQ